MIKVSRTEIENLRKAGLLKEKISHKGIVKQEANYVVANREHIGRDKSYYVAEEYKILRYLGLVKPNPYKKSKGNKNDR